MCSLQKKKKSGRVGKYKEKSILYILFTLVILTLKIIFVANIFVCHLPFSKKLQGVLIFYKIKFIRFSPFHFWPLTHDKKGCHFPWTIKIFIFFSPITLQFYFLHFNCWSLWNLTQYKGWAWDPTLFFPKWLVSFFRSFLE